MWPIFGTSKEAPIITSSTLGHVDVLPIVYADETHNTGENLLDDNQPVFVVSGVHLTDEEAETIVENVTSKLQKGAGEPKYNRLTRRPRNRKRIIEALKLLPQDSVKVSVALKRFMVVSKIVDLGLEELTFADGLNMLADGSAKAYANMLFATGPVLGNPEHFDAVLDTFVRVIMQRGDARPADYDDAVENYLRTTTHGTDTLRTGLLPVPNWIESVIHERGQGLHSSTLDPAVPSVVTLCESFGNLLGEFCLAHDHSKVIENNRELLLSIGDLPNPANPDENLTQLNLSDIVFIDSRSAPQLVIADWVAGAARDAALGQLNPPRGELDEELLSLAEAWLAAPPIWPDQALLEQMAAR